MKPSITVYWELAMLEMKKEIASVDSIVSRDKPIHTKILVQQEHTILTKVKQLALIVDHVMQDVIAKIQVLH